MYFRNRTEAGEILSGHLQTYKSRPAVLVLGLPRGGVPVAYEVARGLNASLDVFMVRKLGVPGHEELGMGAIATGGVRILHEGIIRELGISQLTIDLVSHREQQELERRERLYRGDRPSPSIEGRIVIIVDDGLATGSTMKAAVQARIMPPAADSTKWVALDAKDLKAEGGITLTKQKDGSVLASGA